MRGHRMGAWSRKIDIILDDAEHAFDRVQSLYNRLANKLSWPKAAKALTEKLKQTKPK